MATQSCGRGHSVREVRHDLVGRRLVGREVGLHRVGQVQAHVLERVERLAERRLE
jgi:hypothetical protein